MKKKFFAFVMVVAMVVCVMAMGPAERALAETINDDSAATIVSNDIDRVSEDFRKFERYVEANPKWSQNIVKTMIGHDGDTIVVSTAWIDDGEVFYSTYRYAHDEIAELDVVAALIDGYYAINYWLD